MVNMTNQVNGSNTQRANSNPSGEVLSTPPWKRNVMMKKEFGGRDAQHGEE